MNPQLVTRFIKERSELAGTIGTVELQALALQIELQLNQEKDAQHQLKLRRHLVESLIEELRKI